MADSDVASRSHRGDFEIRPSSMQSNRKHNKIALSTTDNQQRVDTGPKTLKTRAC